MVLGPISTDFYSIVFKISLTIIELQQKMFHYSRILLQHGSSRNYAIPVFQKKKSRGISKPIGSTSIIQCFSKMVQESFQFKIERLADFTSSIQVFLATIQFYKNISLSIGFYLKNTKKNRIYLQIGH